MTTHPLHTGPSGERLERLLRGLAGEHWTYLVLARPLPEGIAGQGLWDTLNELTAVSPTLKLQDAVNRDQRIETTRREVQYYTTALEHLVQRLQTGRDRGLWQVMAYLAGPNEAVTHQALGLLRGTLSGSVGHIEPLRIMLTRPPSAPAPTDLSTVLTSPELGALVQLPRQEVPGYAIEASALFDLDLIPASPGTALELGTVQTGYRDTGQPFSIPLTDLTKHGLICGVTGSGKTTTCFHILNSLWNSGRGVPFLVIEPAKTEYRSLLQAPDLAARLRVYTLGDERWAAFRLNPFEFEWRSDGTGIHVQSHIDYLRSLFNACFVLYPPMPYVLEVALHAVYEEAGWDLATSQNRRLPTPAPMDPATLTRLRSYLFPTLTQLHDKIESVVDALGYDDRIRMDVQAGLKARIHSLRVGGKGLMLDTPTGVPLADLVQHPTLLELQAVGDDEDKAFLIGLILTRLYEYRHAESHHQVGAGLVHATLIEEAHRLLTNSDPSAAGGDTVQPRRQSLETFTNMLAEIRAYGEAILIAEQIPTRLAPAAIKNTNLKLMHRLVAQDDRQIVGATMNFSPAQLRFASTLPTGLAIAYAEGADQSYLIRVPNPRDRFLPAVQTPVTDRQVRDTLRAQGAGTQRPFAWCAGACQVGGGSPCDGSVWAAAVRPPLRARLAHYLASAVENPAHFVLGYDALAAATAAALDRAELAPTARHTLTTCTIQVGLSLLLAERGRQYRWAYLELDDLLSRLRSIVAGVAAGRAQGTAHPALANALGQQTVEFSTRYRTICRRPGPFHDCASCARQCQMRFETAALVPSSWLTRAITDALNQIEEEAQLVAQLADLVTEAGSQILETRTTEARAAAGLCYLRQVAASLSLSPRLQTNLLGQVELLLRQPTPTTRP